MVKSSINPGPTCPPDKKKGCVMRPCLKVSFVALVCAFLTTGFGNAHACMWFTLGATDGSWIVARTMEFGVPFKWQLVVTPRGMQFSSHAPNDKPGLAWKTKHGFVGFYSTGPEGAISEGMNEKGLTFGALWFEPDTKYQEVPPGEEGRALTLTYLGAWILGNFETSDEVKREIQKILVFGEVIKEMDMVPPLHFAVTDSSGKTIVIEYENGKANFYDAPLGIMTNAPNYQWHMTNLRQYIGMSTSPNRGGILSNLNLSPTGHGLGMIGLPGDITPPSRFIKLAVYIDSVIKQPNPEKNLNLAQHIVNAFDIPLGLVVDKASDGKVISMERTDFATFKDLTNKVMYQRLYDNTEITRVDLKKIDFSGDKFKYISLNRGEQKFVDITDQAR